MRVLECLRADRVVLRRFQAEDAPALFEAARQSVEHVFPWLPWCHPQYDRSESERWVRRQIRLWDEGKEFEYSILDYEDLFLGGCGLTNLDFDRMTANLAYWIRSGYTGRGFGTAAVRRLAESGIRQRKLMRIEVLVAVGNVPSQRVAERAGAKREGVLRNRLRIHEKAHDAVVFSFTPAEFLQDETDAVLLR